MPLPQGLARFNRQFGNKLTIPIAQRLPWLGVLHHSGRTTGNRYSTPLMAWSDHSTIIVALFYGSELDWLENARASGHSQMEMGGHQVSLGAPEPVARGEGMKRVPAVVRVMLRIVKVDEFVEFPIL